MPRYGSDYRYGGSPYDRTWGAARSGWRGGYRGRYGEDFARPREYRGHDDRSGYHGPGTDLGVDIARGVVDRDRRGGYYRVIDIGPTYGGPDIGYRTYGYRSAPYSRGPGRPHWRGGYGWNG